MQAHSNHSCLVREWYSGISRLSLITFPSQVQLRLCGGLSVYVYRRINSSDRKRFRRFD